MDETSLHEFFEPFGTVSIRKMFGGFGIFADGLCIACLVRGEIFLKGDAQCEAEYALAGCAQWTYEHGVPGKKINLPYWALTASAHDAPEELKRWGALALQATCRQAAKKAVAPTRKPKKPGSLP